MRNQQHLIIFTRWPQYGVGKRRLAASVGSLTALRFQRTLLRNMILRLATDRRWTTWLAVTPDRSGPWPDICRVLPQRAGDLGERMTRAAEAVPRGSSLIIGSDAPGITRSKIARAFQLLSGHDAVIGPTPDGGYWAIGFNRRRRVAYPYENVRWSSEHAFADTMCNLKSLRVAPLEDLSDVDTGADLIGAKNWELLNVIRVR
jgi:uncharacterized protein